MIPEYGWPRLTAACDRGEPLPAPLQHAAAVAAITISATIVGALIESGRTVESVTVAGLIGVAGYVGAGVLAVVAAPRLVGAPPTTRAYTSRFASAASLPVIASGLLNIIPLPILFLAAAIAGSAMTFWSAMVGARDLLGLEGKARRRTAFTVTLLAGLPVLASNIMRIAV